jgi:ubiquinone biosynthesis accessory factor UbiK
MDTFRIDEIARRLLDNVPPAFRSVQKDLESNFRAVLRASLGKLDLVTRDEFDTQSRVLERTRAKLEALEARVQAFEGGPSGSAVVGTEAVGAASVDTPNASTPSSGTSAGSGGPTTGAPAAGTPGSGTEH